MLGIYLENVRKKVPLVHNITNYVTVNDCANILLAVGGSPIMSDDIEDVQDISRIADAVNLNIGTLNPASVPAMFEAGRIINEENRPVLLDPVGAGASERRTETAKELIEKIRFSVIRGNISEIKALASGISTTKGVDANLADAVTEENADEVIAFAKALSQKTGAVIVMTGAIDLIVDKKNAYLVKNGHPMMSKITGTGCMLSAMMSAFIGANPEDITGACVAAVCAMGVCGERAYDRLLPEEGNATYRTKLIDEVYHLNKERLSEGAKYEMR
ncbi:MAG: hydroxyethylthiazole kinase [Ruminococcaceae bacterium]|nr:hydroxyethylthiazole kinase [Oscillospiraceae bacterium]